MKVEEKKIIDTANSQESAESSDKSPTELEQSRNRDLWNSTGKPAPSEYVANEKEGLGREVAVQGAEKGQAEVSTTELLHTMLDNAWKLREEQGRFDTGGKSAVFYSGEASSSLSRCEALGKDDSDRIHSGELAEYHTRHNPETHIKLEETQGGQELNRIQNWVNSDAVSSSERESLQAKLDIHWSDASQRFAESASMRQSSIGYVEHAKHEGVYESRERPSLDSGKDHFHLTDAPLVDGKPPPEDKIPYGLGPDGIYFRV